MSDAFPHKMAPMGDLQTGGEEEENALLGREGMGVDIGAVQAQNNLQWATSGCEATPHSNNETNTFGTGSFSNPSPHSSPDDLRDIVGQILSNAAPSQRPQNEFPRKLQEDAAAVIRCQAALNQLLASNYTNAVQPAMENADPKFTKLSQRLRVLQRAVHGVALRMDPLSTRRGVCAAGARQPTTGYHRRSLHRCWNCAAVERQLAMGDLGPKTPAWGLCAGTRAPRQCARSLRGIRGACRHAETRMRAIAVCPDVEAEVSVEQRSVEEGDGFGDGMVRRRLSFCAFSICLFSLLIVVYFATVLMAGGYGKRFTY